MKKIFLIVLAVLSVATGATLALLPEAKMEKRVDILASDSVVRQKLEMFKSYFDSTTLSTFQFKLKSRENVTQLFWTYTSPDSNDPMVKVYWYFKKDRWEKEVMEKGLDEIKVASEAK